MCRRKNRFGGNGSDDHIEILLALARIEDRLEDLEEKIDDLHEDLEDHIDSQDEDHECDECDEEEENESCCR